VWGTTLHHSFSSLTSPISHLPVIPLRPAGLALVASLVFLPVALGAQETQPVVAGPPLAPFAAMRVAIVPAQVWHADSTGWSRDVVWATTRLALDSAVAAVLQERGLGRKWAYAGDVVRTAKRNPTYASDPYALGVLRLRGAELKSGSILPQLLADNLRTVTALGDTRYALIPVELRAQGEGVVLRLVMADTRTRTLVWAGDLAAPGGADLIAGLAKRVADLIIEP
jgi:hypothetical protein